MQGINLSKAINFNKRRAGKLWDQGSLPWPLSMNIPPQGFVISPDSQAFAFSVAIFQKFNGLLPDGMLGSNTLAAMNASRPASAETEAGHDFESEGENSVAIGAEPELSTRPARKGVSNCIIINGESVPISQEMIDLGITASNYMDDGEKQFTQYRKRKTASVFVIHESVTTSAAATNRILDAKRNRSANQGKNKGKGWDYGIHLNMCPDGHIICHADLVQHRLVHANHMNDESIGIEVVNPYNPAFGGAPFTRIIKGPWWCWRPKNREKLYTLPTPEQMRAIYPLVRFLTSEIPTLPLAFPTKDLGPRNTRIEGWRDGKKVGAGIVAHRDFASHADGRYLLEHCIEEDKRPIHERV